MLQVDEISLRKWSAGTAHLHTLEQWPQTRGPRATYGLRVSFVRPGIDFGNSK